MLQASFCPACSSTCRTTYLAAHGASASVTSAHTIKASQVFRINGACARNIQARSNSDGSQGKIKEVREEVTASAIYEEGEEPDEKKRQQQEAQQIFERKSEVLLALAGATPTTLEPLISEYNSDIDEILLKILYKRIEAAQRMDEGIEVINGLSLLFTRLRRELERKSSSPVMRLLDELLLIMDTETAETEEQRMDIAVERMRVAFDNEVSAGVDVFAFAQELGERADRGESGDSLASDKEAVNAKEFAETLQQILTGADEKTRAVENDILKKEAEVREAIRQGMFSEEERNKIQKQMIKEREKFDHSSTTVRWCQKLYEAASALVVGDER